MKLFVLGVLFAASVGSAVVASVPQTASAPPSTTSPGASRTPPAAPVVPTPPGAPPVLSELDRLKVINASQAVELWSLKLQQAAGELQKARSEFDHVVATVTPSGWQLNEKLEFVKVDK